MQLLIDVDVGLGRTGVHDPDQAADVARAVLPPSAAQAAGRPGLRRELAAHGGRQRPRRGCGGGHGRGSPTRSQRSGRRAGASSVVTGGGTGTFEADAAQGVLNEVQPGSYAFMDRQYRDALKADRDGAFEQSLVIASTVISANHPQWVTVDAGLKAFATDGPLPVADHGGFEDAPTATSATSTAS